MGGEEEEEVDWEVETDEEQKEGRKEEELERGKIEKVLMKYLLYLHGGGELGQGWGTYLHGGAQWRQTAAGGWGRTGVFICMELSGEPVFVNSEMEQGAPCLYARDLR